MRLKLKERFGGLANPMLVKEMYQSVHSKKFLAAMWLLLMASLFTYVMTYLGHGRGSPAGGTMFGVFTVLIYLMALCVLPYLAFSTLYEEVKGRTIELIHITKMHSGQHVRGRLLASVVKLGLLYAMLAPFAVAAFLFKGVSVEIILLVLYFFFLYSVGACAVGIYFGALTSCVHLRTAARWIYLIIIFFTLFGAISAAGTPLMFWSAGRMPGRIPMRGQVLVMTGVFTVYALLGVWFVSAAAANLLTFDADKSSGRTKSVLTVMVLFGLALPLVFAGLTTGLTQGAVAMSIMGVAPALGLCSLVWLTEKNRVCRRRQKKLERHGTLYRLFYYPFTDGAGPSAAYVFLMCVLLFGASMVFTSYAGSIFIRGGRSRAQLVLGYAVALVFVYSLYFSALTWACSWLLPRRLRTPVARRVIMLSLVLVNCLAGVTVVVATGFGHMELRNPLTALMPLVYLLMLDGPANAGWYVDLALPAALGVTFHLVVVLRHLRRYVRGEFE